MKTETKNLVMILLSIAAVLAGQLIVRGSFLP